MCFFYLRHATCPPISLHVTFSPVACCSHSVHNADDTSNRSFLMNCCYCHLPIVWLLSSGCNASKSKMAEQVTCRILKGDDVVRSFVVLIFTKYFSMIGWTYRMNNVEKCIRNEVITYWALKDAVSMSDCGASVGGMISEEWTGQDVAGSGRDLF
jgi:hypothetical protein